MKNGAHTYTFRTFIATWAITSIIVASLNYIFPTFTIFSERALMLFPAPFLAAITLKILMDRINKKTMHFSKQMQKMITISVVATIILSGWALTYISVAHNQQVWISQPVYEKIVWLSNNHTSEKPIFVYYDYDEYAGTLGNLYNDWVQAIYGNHYSYVGRLDFLLAKQETPFQSPTSKTFSTMFIDKIREDHLFENNTILKHDIIVIDDFYRTGDLKSQYGDILKEVKEGIYIVNTTEALKKQTIALYSSIYQKSGNWYGIEVNWTESKYALEFWNPEPTESSYFETLIPSVNQGKFNLSLTYRDASGSDLLIELNNTLIGRIKYSQTEEMKIFSTPITVSQGIHTLRISFDYTPNVPQYASLDRVEISG